MGEILSEKEPHGSSSANVVNHNYDNATVESFFGALKAEEVQGQIYHDGREARMAIFSYIEAFYNTSRIHTSLPEGASPVPGC